MALSRRTLFSAATAGIVLGGAYALSPLTVWFVIATSALFAAAAKGLTAGERRAVLLVLSAAVALRIAAIAALFLGSDHSHVASFFWDGDGVFLKQRGLWIRNVWLGIPIPPVDFGNAFSRSYGWTTYLYLLAYLQLLMGPALYGLHLLNVVLFTATAVLLYRLARSAYGPQSALLGLALFMFLPTPFMWSVSAMKESLYVFLAVLALVAAIGVLRSPKLGHKVAALVVLVAVVAAVDGVRAGGLLIVTLGIGAGLVGSVVVRRASLVLLLLIILPAATIGLLKVPSVQTRVKSALSLAAQLHHGNVATEGYSYRLLDQRVYSDDAAASMTPPETARFVVRALVSFIVVPLPWQAQSVSGMIFLPQQVVWEVLVLFAIVGLITGLRRDALVTCMLAGLTTVGALVIALNSGNIGTMVRHRDTVVTYVVWLSAVGVLASIARVAGLQVANRRRPVDTEEEMTCL